MMIRVISPNHSVRISALFLASILLLNDCVSFASSLTILDKNTKQKEVFYYLSPLKFKTAESSTPNIKKPQDIEHHNNDDFQLVKSTVASNPTSGESSGFSINSTDGMVDKFTGDFTYSIPLMNVDGYPIVLSYNSNVGMFSEASWVGLGWDLNVGSVSREMRGVPDEFNGTQKITREFNQIQSVHDGQKIGGYLAYYHEIPMVDAKLTPGLQLTALWGSYDNAYLGHGKTFDFGLQASLSITDEEEKMSISPMFGLGYSRDSKNGIGKSKNFGLEGGFSAKNNYAAGGVSFGTSFNSRKGVIDKSFGLSLEESRGRVHGSFSSSTSLSFGSATSIPRVMFDQNSSSHTTSFDAYVSLKTGANIYSAGLMVNGFNSITDLVYNSGHTIFQPAYGYLHSSKRRNHEDDGTYPVMDFERRRDFEFSENMKNLSFSSQTFDIFNVNASGIGGTFRAGRTDFGTYYDPRTKNMHNASSELLIDDNIDQVSMGVVIKPSGVEIEGAYGTGTMKGKMESANWQFGSQNLLEFQAQTNSVFFDNTTYFKQVGESTPNDLSAYITMGANVPEFFDVNKNGNEIVLTDALKQSGNTLNSSLNTLTDRPIRATQFLPKLADEYGVSDVFFSHNYNNTKTAISRKDANFRLGNHISSIDVVSTDGTSYTYGIPVYSIENSEVTFSVDADPSPLPNSADLGLVNFSTGDNSISNVRGRDHYFDKTTMPAYPTAFLLTEMRSSDYIDRTNDGPSIDDIGNYYQFNYHQEYSLSNAFNWRFPISPSSSNGAFMNEGLQGTELDDMANYTVGKKEIWYLHSVETKNYIVEIILDSRQDGHGAAENGQVSSQGLKKIQKIVLYNRNEKLTNPNATPLQTILFTYDYTLCPDDPSNTASGLVGTGKLTLTRVQIFTGNSLENALKSYDFTYSKINKAFDYRDVDGWGNFKENNDPMPNSIYPYSTQNETIANQNASVWKLVRIENPQGGIMDITYESDRYGFVQNKRAMQHLNVHKMTNLLEFLHLQNQSSWNGTSGVYNTFNRSGFDRSGVDVYLDNHTGVGYTQAERDRIVNILFDQKEASEFYSRFEKVVEDIVPNNVIIFPLEEALDGNLSKADANDLVKDKYFMQDGVQIEQLYLKTHVNIKSNGNVADLVPTFATIAKPCASVFHFNLSSNGVPEGLVPIGVMPPVNGEYKYGYVVLDLAVSGSKEGGLGLDNGGIALHPIQKAALEFARANLSDKVYGACANCEGDLSVDKGVIFGADIYRRMILDASYAFNFVSEKSLVRLYDADNIKYGGNARVKKIEYSDNWSVISGEYTSKYEWNYVYEQTRPYQTYGVASFEPGQIADESPFYYWDSYTNFNEKFPDESRFNTTPIADVLFPNPVVGYQEVRVLFANNTDKGYSSSKFHTYKELAYVTQEKKSDLEKTHAKKKNILTGKSMDLYGFTQGYFVQTNDFHGKPDEMSVFDKNNNLQSRSKYHYYGMGEKVAMLDREGQLSMENIAVEFDMHDDSRFIIDDNNVMVAGLKISVRVLPTLGLPKFKPRFSMNSRESGYYSNTLIKHINYSAVVKSIETETLGSINSAENLVYDRFSGNVIVSSLKDEFNDKLYSVNYPSHWYYDELKELTDKKNEIVTLNLSSNASFSQVQHLLTPGDLICDVNNSSTTFRVSKELFETSNYSYFLIREDGSHPTFSPGNYSFRIVDCNRDNRLNETMQNATTKRNPVVGSTFVFPETDIISAGSLTYRDKMNVRCGNNCGESGNNNEIEKNSVYNPYQYGVRGDLVIDGQFSWQSERIQNQESHGIRFDGTYSTYVPYYKLGTDLKWYQLNQGSHPNFSSTLGIQNWRKLGEVTLFDPYGQPLESRDQLKVFSSVLYGYNSTYNLVPVASAVNARLQQIAFDGFEDYLYYLDRNCFVSQSHFDFREQIEPLKGSYLDNTVRHSGLTSLKLLPGKSVVALRQLSDACVTMDEYSNGATLKDNSFVVEDCDCIKTFQPTPGQYIVGAWVNNATPGASVGVRVEFFPSGVTQVYNFYPTGNSIDGWQRIEGEFTVPNDPSLTHIKVTLFNNSSTNANFDDLRIHPFLAGMTTVVYDPKTLLPLATHDGYNFTTFYNYDENLQQSRVKVETVEGIKTILESENGGKIKFEY